MLSVIEKALFLKRVKLFDSMSANHLKIISNVSDEMQIAEREILFEENDACDYLYVIVEGEIEIVKRLGLPEEEVIATLHPPQTFGEMALFGNARRSASARASKDTTLLAIEKDHLLELIQEEPAISVEIIRTLAQIIRHQNEMRIQLLRSGG